MGCIGEKGKSHANQALVSLHIYRVLVDTEKLFGCIQVLPLDVTIPRDS